MKKLLIALTLCTACLAKAQNSEEIITPSPATHQTIWCLQTNAGLSSRHGVNASLGLQAIVKRKLALSATFQAISADAKNIPADYHGGFLLFIPIDAPPNCEIKTLNLTAGRNFFLGKNMWLTAEAGVGIGNATELSFKKQSSGFFIIGMSSNYEVIESKTQVFAPVLKTDFVWAFSSFMGVGAGLYGNFNKVQSSVGGEIKLVFGKLRQKHK